MYTLLKPIHGGLGLLVQEVENHIKATALDAVKRLKGDNVCIQSGDRNGFSILAIFSILPIWLK